MQAADAHLHYGLKPRPCLLCRDDYCEAKQGERAATVAGVTAEDGCFEQFGHDSQYRIFKFFA